MRRSREETIDVVTCGDDLLGVSVASPEAAQRLAADLRDTGDWCDAVGGIDTVVAQFDATKLAFDEATARLRAAALSAEPHDDKTTGELTIPVIYDGPDIDSVCEQLGLTREALVSLHTRDEYHVEMLGFVPGFAYIGGLDPALDVPRLSNPRQRVPAGSIGITGGRSGIYALAAPGGWPLIGRTTMTLFDPGADDPFVLAAGMRVRFEAVGEEGSE